MAQSAITPPISARIEALRASGVHGKTPLLRALKSDGTPLNWRTLDRYLREHPYAPKPGECVQVPTDAQVLDAVEGDDVSELDRHARVLKGALASWERTLGIDPTAARTYSTLSQRYEAVRARLYELRPRPEVEADRLVALGDAARDALLERAVTAATPDELAALRERVEAQSACIDNLLAERDVDAAQ